MKPPKATPSSLSLKIALHAGVVARPSFAAQKRQGLSLKLFIAELIEGYIGIYWR